MMNFRSYSTSFAILLVLSPLLSTGDATEKPNIIFILADDLGFNDVGFRGANDIQTPNIDALAYSGVILHNYYVTPICTPSRSALMTGKYPIHTGMQHTVLFGAEPRGLPLTEKILPQYLEDLGYVNHIVGKWHLGSYKKEYTPLYRGFKSHLGKHGTKCFWTGHQDYFDHTAVERPGWGLDMRRNMSVAYDLHGQYSTDLFGREAATIIEHHDTSTPLFLYLAHAAVHSGNPYNPLPAHDDKVEKFRHIGNYQRQRFAGMLSSLDDSVGTVIRALQSRDMLRDSIVIFSTDNGGPASGFNLNAASNWPLRGVKNTLWEGGVRGAGLIWSPIIKRRSRLYQGIMHIVDWLPTLLEAAGTPTSDIKNLDGMSMWRSITEDVNSGRTEILHNIDDIFGNAALSSNGWKITKGATYDGIWDYWYGPDGRNHTYNVSSVGNSAVGQVLRDLNMSTSSQKIEELRRAANVVCNVTEEAEVVCKPLERPCLFHIETDPCEKVNLADKYPEKLQQLLDILERYNRTALPPENLPLDPRGDPKYWNYVFTNFGDYTDK
ncbi:unnamed protein product [Acanthoscelides obtectus]|uniref:Sulfatase N-terminal domain-containing protein n=1 Tax=Acanthoscelides obtectus TaxID=200917 RepID=A0A9P0PWD4_ACAOB|nr:unnamed protein product [Acanthoscelides obtectus]CAK1659276.1 Arylsulfatase B [Acanthoscelides obtectus]